MKGIIRARLCLSEGQSLQLIHFSCENHVFCLDLHTPQSNLKPSSVDFRRDSPLVGVITTAGLLQNSDTKGNLNLICCLSRVVL